MAEGSALASRPNAPLRRAGLPSCGASEADQLLCVPLMASPSSLVKGTKGTMLPP